jgi:hypothetical protein
MTGIFISYRQDDAKPWALLLRDELAGVFGDEHLFLDKDTLRAGNWREQIREALDRCRVVLVVMGRRWLTIMDENVQRHLDRTDDVHRQEVALALSRSDVTVIPVRVDGAPMPHHEDLPEDIRSITDQQSHELSDSRARRELDLKLLVADIERATGLKARRGPPGKDASESHSASHGRWLGTLTKILLASLAASVGVLVMAEIAFGWRFEDPQEISLIVLIILAVTTLGARLRARRKEKNNHANP